MPKNYTSDTVYTNHQVLIEYINNLPDGKNYHIDDGLCFALSLEYLYQYGMMVTPDAKALWTTIMDSLLHETLEPGMRLSKIVKTQETYQQSSNKAADVLIQEGMDSISTGTKSMLLFGHANLRGDAGKLERVIDRICDLLNNGKSVLLCYLFENTQKKLCGHAVACVSGVSSDFSQAQWWMFDPAKGTRRANRIGKDGFRAMLNEYLTAKVHVAKLIDIAEF